MSGKMAGRGNWAEGPEPGSPELMLQPLLGGECGGSGEYAKNIIWNSQKILINIIFIKQQQQ